MEFVVADIVGGEFGNNANIRIVNFVMMTLFTSVKN